MLNSNRSKGPFPTVALCSLWTWHSNYVWNNSKLQAHFKTVETGSPPVHSREVVSEQMWFLVKPAVPGLNLAWSSPCQGDPSKQLQLVHAELYDFCNMQTEFKIYFEECLFTMEHWVTESAIAVGKPWGGMLHGQFAQILHAMMISTVEAKHTEQCHIQVALVLRSSSICGMYV